MPNDLPEIARQGLVEALQQLSRRCGGVVRHEDGLLLVAGNHPCPVLVNSALRTGAMDADEVLSRAKDFFHEIGHHWETWILAGVDDDIEVAAKAAGMRLAADLSGMILQESPDIPQMGAGIDCKKVEDLRGVQDFSTVCAEGFRDEAPGMADLVRSIFSEPRSLIAADTAAFVVFDQGAPASTAMTISRNGVAWIGWVATRPESRGRGLGSLATAAATRAGFALGASCASLEATKMGAPVYRRLGFREEIRYRNYWPADFSR